jgi:hypothetical protein
MYVSICNSRPAFEDTRLEALAQETGAEIAEAAGERRGEVVAPDGNDAPAEGGREQLLAAADLTPVIAQLMDLAREAQDLGTAAAMSAARGLLIEAARLKGLLAEQCPQATSGRLREPQLTKEEWVEIFGPKR